MTFNNSIIVLLYLFTFVKYFNINYKTENYNKRLNFNIIVKYPNQSL